MVDTAKRLKEGDPSTYTQEVERQILSVLLELKEALEREQRKPKKKKGGGGGGGGGKRRLVPPLAELKMLRKMESDLLTNTRDLNEAIKLSGGKPNYVQQQLLKRLATRQGNVADLLKKISDQLSGGDR